MESNNKFEYVFENNEFLMAADAEEEQQENSNAAADDDDDNNQYGEIVYTSDSGSQTILLHNGEYYIQTDGETLLLGEGPEDIDQLVINENSESQTSFHVQSEDDSNVIRYLEGGDSCEPPVIYKFVEDDDDDADKTYDACEPPQKKIKVENYLVELDEGLNFECENLEEQQGGLTSSRFQYAVIKDGKLHLQLCDADSIEILKGIVEGGGGGDDSPEASLELCAPGMLEATGVLDLSKVTGRNLITGQTITLDDYLKRVHNKMTGVEELEVVKTTTTTTTTTSTDGTFLNKKFTIGRTMEGKRLVAKILQIKPGAEDDDDDGDGDDPQEKEAEPGGEDAPPAPTQINVQELIFDSTGKILKVGDARELRFNEGATPEHLQFLSKTLSRLADMESIRRKLLDRELRVKFVEKQYESRTQDFRKKVVHLKGCLALQEATAAAQPKNEYVFVLNDDEEEEPEEAVEGHGKKKSKNNCAEDWTSLSVVITQERSGHKTTRVNFYERTDSSATACKLCNREFKSVGHLNRHLSTSHWDKTLTCHICQTKFGDQVLLNKHRRQHEHYFACATCGKSFTTQSSLRRHLSVHDHSLRPLECTICNARFTDESSLCKHLIIHTGIKAYHCDVCQKAFTTVGDLNFHKRVHDPVKMFYCEVCGREFSRHSNLLRHTEIHKGAAGDGDGGDLYKCGVCGCSYKYISSLTRHVVQNHMATT